jgi:hypothetical protein
MADMGVAAIALTQSFAQFQTYMPKISDIRKADPKVDFDLVGDVRIGEIAAFVGSVGVGVIVSSITNDPVPAYVSVAVCLILIALYESVLRSIRPMENPA